MSKKWLNPPLTLVSAKENDECSGNLAGHARSTSAGLLHPANAGTDLASRRESVLSETQYAIAGLPHQYADLPSAVPFQDALTPALPSAEFPSSVRGFATPPGSSSTADFPSASVYRTTYQPTSPENGPLSNPSMRGDPALHAASVDPTTISGAPGATALSRQDSSVSYNSIWSGTSSNQHFALDITQFPRPPESASDDLSPALTSTLPSSFNPLRRITKLQPPAPPLYEESEPSGSRPSTPGTVSYKYPLTTPNPTLHSTLTHHVDTLSDPRHASIPTASLIPPSPAPTDARASFQTVASRGSSAPRFSMNEDSSPSTLAEPAPAWDRVMNSVKPNWNTSGTNAHNERLMTKQLDPPSLGSSGIVLGVNAAGKGQSTTLLVPQRSSVSAQSPMSLESNSDVYSAIGRMNFPKPPSVLNPGSEDPSPISPGTPRTPWITGVTLLRRKSSRSSVSSPKRSAEPSLVLPAIPPVLPATVPSVPFSTGVSASIVVNSPTETHGETTFSSSGKESRENPMLSVPTNARPISASAISDRAPSYDRRVAELVQATNESPPPPRESAASLTSYTTTDTSRNSVDGAVVGVARTASLSARARALLTRGPSINTGSQELTPSYLIPSPLPSAQFSDASLPSTPSVIPQTAPLNLRKNDATNLRQPDTALQRPPAIKELGSFPESVGSSRSLGEGSDAISLHRIQSHDVPHSAVPLNQSTPFQNYFPDSSTPTSYRPSRVSLNPDPPGTPTSRPSHSGSKPRSQRSSILSNLGRPPSRIIKALSWFRKMPLPELPPSPTREKGEKIQSNTNDESPTPDLSGHAAGMNEYNDVGVLPSRNPAPRLDVESKGYTHGINPPRRSIQSVISTLSDRAKPERRRTKSVGFAPLNDHRLESNDRQENLLTSSLQRRKIIWFVIVICALLAVSIPIAVVFSRKSERLPLVATTCTDEAMTGASCQLNSTCVCTSDIAGNCNPVAQSLLDLISPANTLFGINMTANDLALALWDLQGDPPMGNCATQAILVDVAPALNETASPNRTEFARTAILYNLVRTYDLASTAALRSFISSADFTPLRDQDGPVTDDSLNMSLQSAGFVFDFASMTVSPTSIVWTENSGVDETQIERVGFFADQALDRMYSFATASSVQRSTALTRYWTTILQLPESDVSKFISALNSSPVILPFDTSSRDVTEFLVNTTSNDGISLPAPVACLPDISPQGRRNVDLIESNAFGLVALGDGPSTLDSSCFPDRPLYGVLDVLRLRRAFGDERSSMRIPSAQLISDAAPRVVLHNGEQLVGLTGANDTGIAAQTEFTEVFADPREYGTFEHLNHIALSWLQSFPNVSLATLAAQHVLSINDASTPPTSGNPLFDQTNGLMDFPTIEVAVFGTMLPTDIEVFRADFGTPTGGLFFGSNGGEIFRRWALRDDNDVILWSESSTASQVVREHLQEDADFETVWTQASELISSASEVGRGTGIPEIRTIVAALQDAQLFS